MRYNIAVLSILATIGLLFYPWKPDEQAIAYSYNEISSQLLHS
jgi:hypothetical protein